MYKNNYNPKLLNLGSQKHENTDELQVRNI